MPQPISNRIANGQLKRRPQNSFRFWEKHGIQRGTRSALFSSIIPGVLQELFIKNENVRKEGKPFQ